MSQFNISVSDFNDVTQREMRWGDQDSFVDCWEFTDSIVQAATGIPYSIAAIEFNTPGLTDSLLRPPAVEQKVLNILETNLNQQFVDAIKGPDEHLSVRNIERYLINTGETIVTADPSLQHMNQHGYLVADGHLNTKELHMLYHVMTHIHAGGFTRVPDSFAGTDNSLKTHVPMDEFSAIWDPEFGEERDLPAVPEAPPPAPYAREIDYFGQPQSVDDEITVSPLRFEILGEDISFRVAQPTESGQTYVDADRAGVELLGVSTIDGRRVATLKSHVIYDDMTANADDPYHDILEISWDPQISDRNPDLKIQSWVGHNTPQGQALLALKSRGIASDLDGDWRPDSPIELQTTMGRFVQKTADHPDGIDESQPTLHHGQPVENGRVGVTHTNIGRRVQ